MSIARSAAPARKAFASLARAAAPQRAFSSANANGVTVAASDDGNPTASITVALKAGPRFETTPGVAHVLKNFVFKSTDKRSALRIVREAELLGGVLSSSLTKEHLLLTAEFLRGDEDFFAELLGDVLSNSKLLRHEFNEEVLPNVQSEYEQALNSPAVLGYDALTQTAYRGRGLGASLFALPASPVSHSEAVAYAKSAFSKSNMVVLGSGIESSSLSNLVSKTFGGVNASGSLQAGPNTYYGGDERISFTAHHGAEGPRANHGHFLIGFEGAGLGRAPELAVLRALLGGESSVKWSAGLSPLSKISENVAGANSSAFNLTFSDSGLFGAYVTAPHDKVTATVKETINAFKEIAGSVKEEDLQKAVAKAKFEAANALESRAASHEAISAQLLSSGKIQTLDEVFSALDNVKAASVSEAAEKLLKSKPTTVAVGDVHKLPYGDECF